MGTTRINRRDFLKSGSAGVLVGGMAAGGESRTMLPARQARARSGIDYIRQDIPAFTIPPHRGERYDDVVPDTLDLAERARLAIHGMTSSTDPAIDYEQYFLAVFYRNPPVLRHEASDPYVQPKFFEALPLLRTVTGSTLNDHVDPVWVRMLLKSIGPDGGYYIATGGRPWFQLGISAWTPNVCLEDGRIVSSKDAPLSQITNPTVSGRIISTMTLLHERDRDPMWRRAAEQMIRKWADLAVHRDDFSYYPVAIFVPGSKVGSDVQPPTGLLAAESGYRLIQGLAHYYRAAGYEPARDLAGRLSNYVRHHAKFFDANGRFIDRDHPEPRGHFHGHTLALLSMLEYAVVAQDKDLIDFVRRSYEWARDDAFGNPLIGWFPESVRRDFPVSELCCEADMVALAVKLSEAGAGDYWDDADRYLRNNFAEGQLTRVDWVYRVARSLPRTTVAPNETADRPAERSLGAFSGYTTGCDYGITSGAPTGVAQCCTGNAARAIYYAWQAILEKRADEFRVNLLLNRASKWADIHSYLPYEGRVDVKVKAALPKLTIRVPAWVESRSEAVECRINGSRRRLGWQGRYVDVGAVDAGDEVALTFPIAEREVRERIGGVDYTLILKGSSVVFIDPTGEYHRLYQRDHYRASQVRWRRASRFVPDDETYW
ncbi:MAG: hypothetical protein ACRD2X_22430 [Vicinamibacteraceae bacterium]